MSTSSFHKRALQLEIDRSLGSHPNATIMVADNGGVYWMPKSGNLYLMDEFPAHFGHGYTKSNLDLALPFKRSEFQKIIDKL